jgi:hypothetical protein
MGMYGTTSSAAARIQVTTCDNVTEALDLLHHNGTKDQ